MKHFFSLARWPAGCAVLLAALLSHVEHPEQGTRFAARAASGASSAPRTLMVGGGPSLDSNQVGIESNVRYLNALLPPQAPRITLFADGDLKHATVLYNDDKSAGRDAASSRSSGEQASGERVLQLLMSQGEDASRWRKPRLGGRLDGPSSRAAIANAFARLGRETAREAASNGQAARPLLLYFTGHGDSDKRGYENNLYSLWGEEELSVRDLAGHIARLPAQAPVVVVMVQCYSGSFGNLLFAGGDAKGATIGRDIAGFFASTKERMAAGCTPEVNEAEYHDFTSYFFAALCGRDRVGRRVTGADYNGDGRVGMNEAFCYTLARDESIDVPVCTSDVFLRRFVPKPDAEVFAMPYEQAKAWATPAQRAALEALSSRLKLSGEGRLSAAMNRLRAWQNGDEDGSGEQIYRRFMALRREGRREVLRRWPQLRGGAQNSSTQQAAARRAAIAVLTQQAGAGRWKELLSATDNLNKIYAASEAREIEEARLIRFVRLAKSIVLAHALREGTNAPLQARFARLLAAESRTLLPPVAAPTQ